MASIAFDRSVLKVNQMILMVTIVVGYVIGLAYPAIAWILPVLALMMLAGVASPSLNVPRILYTQVLRPRASSSRGSCRRIRRRTGSRSSRRRVPGRGSVFVITNVLLVAWVLAWIVAALAFLNFAFNICVGCIMYAQLVRIGLLPLRREPAR